MGLNAQTSVPAFVTGQVLTAAQQTQINTGVPVFASTVTRDAAFGGTGEKTLAEGQTCWIEGTGLQIYNGTSWVPYGYAISYTPTWTSTGTQPAIGNGSLSGIYVRIGSWISFRITMSFGSTTTFGTGNYRFGLPVATNTDNNIGYYAQALDTMVAWYYNAYGEGRSDASTTYFNLYTNANAIYGPTVPFTFGNGDGIWITGQYIVS